MKKTLISLVLVFALLSTCLFSMAFAAYTTSGEGSVTATVSTFGVTVSVSNTGATTTLTPKGSGTLLTLKTEGSPSVAATTTYTATLAKKDGSTWKAGDADYFPIEFTVDGVTYGLYGEQVNGVYEKCDDFGALKTAVEDAIADLGGSYAEEIHVITWGWANGTTASDNKLLSTDGITLSVDAEVNQD